MVTLTRDLRRALENTVKEARRVAEEGARKALESFAVHHHEPWTGLGPDKRTLRNRLRAHGRQLGDKRDERRGTQTIERLVSECAYEHWHRMLFARFLAENNLLIEPSTGVAITLQECQELARERNEDWLEMASSFAIGMLPQIFRQDDPVLEIDLPAETLSRLEDILKALPSEDFLADDSLGWVYQFWQTDKKKEINDSEIKIGDDELPAVTQLFTEDYMVLFLLHNTLGAWWAGKVLSGNPELAASAQTEDELRAACAVGGIEWTYLRFVRDGEDGSWRPAAGTFDGWPKEAKEIILLDPCMGSGHFLVFALPILTAFRTAQEGLSEEAAIDAVLRDNLFGLEIDLRCTQIAAFNLALSAWRRVGYRTLPVMHMACSGLGVAAKKEEWMILAAGSEKIQVGMERLYHLFQNAPVLGSLINPAILNRDLLMAGFRDLQPLMEQALKLEASGEKHELTVTAKGIVEAADILSKQFTLVVTNVPYLGLRKQNEILRNFCMENYPKSKHDLACVFIERCLQFVKNSCTISLVAPRSWTHKNYFKKLRESFLKISALKVLAILGTGAFETISGEVVDVTLFCSDNQPPSKEHRFGALDATDISEAKKNILKSFELELVDQLMQLKNPDHRISLHKLHGGRLLEEYAIIPQGIKTGDDGKWIKLFWELPAMFSGWEFCQSSTSETIDFGGRECIIDWRTGGTGMIRPRLDSPVVGKIGIGVSQTGVCKFTIYSGQRFDSKVAPIVPRNKDDLLAIWVFCSSESYSVSLSTLSPGLFKTNSAFLKVPFDLTHWQRIADEKYPNGLPNPYTTDPTQWIFNGYPKDSDYPLQVAVARLLGYQWPRQTGSSFMDCTALGSDGLEMHADNDGIVCLTPLRGESPADKRVMSLLSDAYGSEWSAGKLANMLTEVSYKSKPLDDWLRDGFFEQHCALFHQRPFIWHIWDGRRDGFHALVNYHKLSAPNGEGKRTLETLIYTYLGDWIDDQRKDQKAGVEGADGRVAAAEHLKAELEKILAGEPPYDIFVRWKPLHEQAIGWEPDINDGVRMNIRPFMIAKPLDARAKGACILRTTPKIKWQKGRGKEPNRSKEEFPWFWSWDPDNPTQAVDFTGNKDFDGNRWNDLHFTIAFKQAARARRK